MAVSATAMRLQAVGGMRMQYDTNNHQYAVCPLCSANQAPAIDPELDPDAIVFNGWAAKHFEVFHDGTQEDLDFLGFRIGAPGIMLQEFTSTVGEPVLLEDQAIPERALGVRITLIAPGGAGASGRRGANGAGRAGGGGGGGGGSCRDLFVPVSHMGEVWSLSLQAPATGGAAVTANDTNGNNGGAGGLDSTFSSGTFLLRILGGGPGTGGTAASGPAGAAGGGLIGGGAGANGTLTNGNAAGTHTLGGATGGGGGGGITAADVANNGGFGGSNSRFGPATLLSTPGTPDGALPGAGHPLTPGAPGCGAGGGASSITTAAQAGADAIGYGAGGGGGGASVNGNNSGRGGDGGPGYARLEWIF